MLVPDPESPSGERAKILDFGIAKLLSIGQNSVRTNTRALMGTPLYMAPEQCRGMKNVGDRADVYSLGVMIYEMLTGRPPFLTDSPADVMAMHLSQAPQDIATLAPNLNRTLGRLVMAMLAKEPERRPAMDAVVRSLKDLRSMSGDSLIKGRPPELVSASDPSPIAAADKSAPAGMPANVRKGIPVSSPVAATVAASGPHPVTPADSAAAPKDPRWQSVQIVAEQAAKTLPSAGNQSRISTRPIILIAILIAIALLTGLLILWH